jgi:hypothetical protein
VHKPDRHTLVCVTCAKKVGLTCGEPSMSPLGMWRHRWNDNWPELVFLSDKGCYGCGDTSDATRMTCACNLYVEEEEEK